MSTKPTRYVPRWLHFSANIESDADGWHFTEVPPNVFANETIWPFRLESLAITGLPPYAPLPLGDSAQFWGGLGTCINLELGISGTADVNQVVGTAGAIMSHQQRRIKGPVAPNGAAADYLDDTLFKRFKYPYLLARGNGFSVEFVNTRDEFIYDNHPALATYGGIPAFVAHGVGVTSGQPVMLAGSYRQTDAPGTWPTVAPGSGVTFDGADLVNDGHEDVLIHSIGVSYPYRNVAHTVTPPPEDIEFLSLFALYSRYLINPINGVKWMPGSDALPIMGICPDEVMWPMVGSAPVAPVLQIPAIYDFPPNTLLSRRQRLSVKMSNHAVVMPGLTAPIRANITLFGYLEVR